MIQRMIIVDSAVTAFARCVHKSRGSFKFFFFDSSRSRLFAHISCAVYISN